MNTRRMTLLIAIVLALGTGYLTISYLGSLRAEAPPQVTMRSIVVAGQDIPARAKITPEMLKIVQRATNEVEPDAVVEPKQTIGTLALITIPAGAAITQSKIGRPVDIGLTPRLQRGERAISIGIDRVKGVSGLVQPGDRVDVIAIPPRTGTNPKAYTILRGVVVLALGNELEQAGATPAPGAQDLTTVTLAVTPKQADLLEMADTQGAGPVVPDRAADVRRAGSTGRRRCSGRAGACSRERASAVHVWPRWAPARSRHDRGAPEHGQRDRNRRRSRGSGSRIGTLVCSLRS